MPFARMLRRAKLLHAAAQQRQSAGKQVHGAEQQKESAAGSSTDAGVKRKRQLDLRGSPLMRLAASQVGRGAAASTFGDVARAACSEAGTKNVSSGGSAVHLLKFLSCALQLNACMHIHIYKALAQLLLFPWVRTSIMPNEISWLL